MARRARYVDLPPVGPDPRTGPGQKDRTAASLAAMGGENLPLVGKLLGHRQHRTTASYAHVAEAHLVGAAEKVGAATAGGGDGSCDFAACFRPQYPPQPKRYVSSSRVRRVARVLGPIGIALTERWFAGSGGRPPPSPLGPCADARGRLEGHFRALPCLAPAHGALCQFFCAVADEERSRGDMAPPDGAGPSAQSLLPIPDLGIVAAFEARVVVIDDNGASTARQRAGLALGDALCMLALPGAKRLGFPEPIVRGGEHQVAISQTLHRSREPCIAPPGLTGARASLKVQFVAPEHCAAGKQTGLLNCGYVPPARFNDSAENPEGTFVKTLPCLGVFEIPRVSSIISPLAREEVPGNTKPETT